MSQMYVLDQLSVAPNRRLWTLVDTTTNLPLLFPLLFLIETLTCGDALIE
jgi:hypothetical protein